MKRKIAPASTNTLSRYFVPVTSSPSVTTTAQPSSSSSTTIVPNAQAEIARCEECEDSLAELRSVNYAYIYCFAKSGIIGVTDASNVPVNFASLAFIDYILHQRCV